MLVFWKFDINADIMVFLIIVEIYNLIDITLFLLFRSISSVVANSRSLFFCSPIVFYLYFLIFFFLFFCSKNSAVLAWAGFVSLESLEWRSLTIIL